MKSPLELRKERDAHLARVEELRPKVAAAQVEHKAAEDAWLGLKDMLVSARRHQHEVAGKLIKLEQEFNAARDAAHFCDRDLKQRAAGR